MSEEKKAKINGLLNIDNFTGDHTGRMAPTIIFLIIGLSPFLLWLMISFILPFKIFLIPWMLWIGRWALYIFGKEKQRLAVYRASKNNEYSSAYKLVHVQHQHSDGLFEYTNGQVAYIVSCCPKFYLNDDQFTHDLEEFLKQFDGYNFDCYIHNIVDEVKLENNFENLSIYSDKQIIADRIEVLTLNDEYCRCNSGGYRFNIVVKASKYSWKKLKEKVFTVVNSDYANMFNECYVCDMDKVSDVFSRDVKIWIDLQKMLTNKFDNDQFYDSRVLYYGDEVPEEYREVPETSSLDERRVGDDK